MRDSGKKNGYHLSNEPVMEKEFGFMLSTASNT